MSFSRKHFPPSDNDLDGCRDASPGANVCIKPGFYWNREHELVPDDADSSTCVVR